VLTFAIRPALFVDGGPAALAALEARIAADKKLRSINKRRSRSLSDDEQDD